MKKIKVLFFTLLLIVSAHADAQYSVSGTVADAITSLPVASVRIILYNSDTSYFFETRTNASGNYLLSAVPPDVYTIGIAKQGKDYLDTTLNIISDITDINFYLYDEAQKGEWNIIVNSPEPLGGTDLGILLPNGKIFYCHDTEEPFLFDPLINDTVIFIGDDSVQGCVGPLLLEDGKVIFMGGTLEEVYGPGSKKVKTWNAEANVWQTISPLLDYRWYPTVTSLPNGKILVAGGGGLDNPVRVNTSELYDPFTGEQSLTDTLALGNEVSPILYLYTGEVLMTHRPPQLFDPLTNQWDLAADFVQGNRMANGDHSDHELVLMPYGDERAIAIGYKSFIPGVYGNMVEIYNAADDSWSLGNNFSPVRSRAKTVMMPDKKILVVGGYKEDITDPSEVNDWGYMFLTDEYDPYADSWRRLDDINYAREYHCNTILVPDGRLIAVGGEGQPGNEPPFSVIEAFTPPYLYRGVRPVITSIDNDEYVRGDEINLNVKFADSVTSVQLMSNAVVTHFMNSGNNRFVELNFTQTGNAITASIPPDSVILPNGYYMLFTMVDDIPSIAKIIHVSGTSIPLNIESSQLDLNNDINIYPNPATSFVTIDGLTSAKFYVITLYDVHNRMIKTYQQMVSDSKAKIELPALASGMYFIHVRSGADSIYKKLIIQQQ